VVGRGDILGKEDYSMPNGMRNRLLTGVVLGLLGAVVVLTTPAVGATAQESPAASADTFITLSAKCVRDGAKVRVDYTVRSWEPELTADQVEVSYKIVGGPGSGQLPSGSFGPGQEEFSGDFLIDAPTEEGLTLVLTARAHWSDPNEKSISKHSAPLPLPTCSSGTSSTTSTTIATSPSSTVGGQTTTSAVLGATSSTTGRQLPFTGTHSGATLLAGVGLLAGGALVLWAGRSRGRHAR
jgi:hypothetical protein